MFATRFAILSTLAIMLIATSSGMAQASEAEVSDPALLTAAGPLLQPMHLSWDEIFERRVIRVLVAVNQTSYFLDGARARGITADALAELEKHLNATLKVGHRKMHVVAIPVNRDQLIPYLAEGRGDVASANLTITPERLEQVDFSVPTSKLVNELIVTGPTSPELSRIEDLAGSQVHVRESSSFWESLGRVSDDLVARGLAPIERIAASEYLETEDLLEMVNAGLIPMTVADSHIAAFWKDVLTDLVVHGELKIAEGTRIGWAIRKDATGLKAVLDPWVDANRQGKLLGNMLLKRYLQGNVYVKSATAEASRRRFEDMIDLFRRYAGEYDFDPLLVAAQGYQESKLDQSTRSPVGAIGVMQVMPTTAQDPAVGITNIDELEPNIHAGTKYLRHLVKTYFNDPEIDPQNQLLFAFAGYNAGPNRIQRLRKQAAKEGYDPNRWFRHVERVVAREVGREPVHYVANIYKYYIAYSLLVEQDNGQTRKTR